MKKYLLPLLAFLCLSPASFAQEYGVVNISVCNLRRTADFDAEMVSQALLGTPVHVLEMSGNEPSWPQVRTPDDYTGWVHYAAVTRMTYAQYHAWNSAPKVVVTSLYGMVREKPSRKSAVVSDVVAGDRLVLTGRRAGWYHVRFPDGRTGFVHRKDCMEESAWRRQLDTSAEAILASARSMLGFPYLWAGMSPKGMDCSGFVRTVLFMHDIIIPRDCGQMYRKGERIDDVSLLQPGDLVFFGRYREDGTPRPSHVGFYLGEGRFIHSLGLVKIGSLRPEDPLYDAYNAGRYLFGNRILPYIDREEGLCTSASNPYYSE